MRPSIVLLTRNEERNIGACLNAVYSQTGFPDPEVILIDSASRDRTLGIASSYPVRLVGIRPEDFHHGRTRNLGASLASGDCIVFLSADALPVDEVWLRSLLEPFADRAVGAVYGRQLPKLDATPERVFFMHQRYGTARVVKSGPPPPGGKYRHYQFSNVNSAVRRDVWARTRFPEDLNAYEDFGLAIRILGQGFSIVYEPAAAVYHSHNYPLFYSFKQYFDTGIMYNHFGLWDPEHQRGLRHDGLRHFLEEMRFLAASGKLHRCPYAAAYELARYLGVLAGKRERWLPRFLKKRLSSHGLFN